MEGRQTTTVDLRKKFQTFTERIHKIVKFLEKSTDKKQVREAAVGALLSAIPTGRVRWVVGLHSRALNQMDSLPREISPGIQRTSTNASGSREDGIPQDQAPLPIHAAAHWIPAEHARLRGNQSGTPSPTFTVPSGGGRWSHRASCEDNRPLTSAKGARLQKIRAAHEVQRGTVLRGQRPDGTHRPRGDK
ncbi:hypothetical protein RUND412_003151 [Rhizina undulata]